MLPRPKRPGDQQEGAEDPCRDRHEEAERVGVHSRRSPADRFRNRMDLDLVFAARRIPHLVAPPVVRDDVIQDGPGTVLRGDVGPIQVAPLRSHRNRVEVVQADALQPQGDVRDPARIRDLAETVIDSPTYPSPARTCPTVGGEASKTGCIRGYRSWAE